MILQHGTKSTQALDALRQAVSSLFQIGTSLSVRQISWTPLAQIYLMNLILRKLLIY